LLEQRERKKLGIRLLYFLTLYNYSIIVCKYIFDVREFYFGHCRTRSKCTIILDKLIIKALVYGELKTRALNRTFEDSHAWRELVYVETHMPFGMKKGEPCIKVRHVLY